LHAVRCEIVREVDEPADPALVVRRSPQLLRTVSRLDLDHAVRFADVGVREFLAKTLLSCHVCDLVVCLEAVAFEVLLV